MDLDDGPSQEGIPLVYDGVLYFPAPLDVTYALDAATGKKIWEHRRTLPEDLGKFVPFPHTNRNLAIYGKLSSTTARTRSSMRSTPVTGKLAWENEIYDYRTRRAKQGSAPFVAHGVLISGRNCQPQGGPESCVITGHDARTGKELWRKRTIPKPGEPGGDSWGDVPDERRWHVGAWMIPSYDPELDLVYIGTSVTAPAPKFMIAGNDKQYLYHNSTLALRPETGETVWYYQHAVDHWDLDHPFERILVDVAVAPSRDEVPWINPRVRSGEVRKVMTGIPGKTGLVYTLDRATGEFLWARPTITQNVISAIDGRRQSHDQPGCAVHRPESGALRVPHDARRQELARGRVQPAHQNDVLPDAEHLHDRDLRRGGRDARADLRDQHPSRHHARHRRTSAPSKPSTRRPARRAGNTTNAPESPRSSRPAAT